MESAAVSPQLVALWFSDLRAAAGARWRPVQGTNGEILQRENRNQHIKEKETVLHTHIHMYVCGILNIIFTHTHIDTLHSYIIYIYMYNNNDKNHNTI